jgi:hypothetical protein
LAGLPLHLADFSGSTVVIRYSFGSERGELLPGSEERLRLSLAAAAGVETFWSANSLHYTISEWGVDGGRRTTLIASPAWLANPTNTYGIGGRNTPPAPRIIGLNLESRDRLWVFGITADAEWQNAWIGKRLVIGEQSASTLPSLVDLYQTVIEVVDPTTRRLIARAATRRIVLNALPRSRAARYFESKDGVPAVEIVRLQLRER